MTKRMRAGLVTWLLLAGAWLMWVAAGTQPEPVAAGRWVEVKPMLLENRLGLIGRIEAARQVVLAAPFDGVIARLAAQEGEQVKKGQPLLALDTGQLDIQLRQAQAELLKAQAAESALRQWAQGPEVLRARRTLSGAQARLRDLLAEEADTRRLFDQGIVARVELETATRQLQGQRQEVEVARDELDTVLARGNGEERRIAGMELANAQARLRQVQDSRSLRVLKAPFAGVLLRAQGADGTPLQALEQGAAVVRGQGLWRLVDPAQYRVISQVEEADLHALREGMPVEITGEGFGGRVLQGRIEAIGVQGKASDTPGAGAYYPVKVAVEPGSEGPRLGMSARLGVITWRNEQGVAVPAEALRRGENGEVYVVYRRDPQALVRRVVVTEGVAVVQGVEVMGLEAGWVELQGGGASF